MQRLLCMSLGLMLATSSAMGEEKKEDLKSGLQKGDSAGYFLVKDITGPRKGTSLCYR